MIQEHYEMAKLTARQLMIGDWVMFGSHQPVKVYAIGNNFIDLRYGKIKQSGILALCDFEPIPLTEEILKANGFLHHDCWNKGCYAYDAHKQDILWSMGLLIL